LSAGRKTAVEDWADQYSARRSTSAVNGPTGAPWRAASTRSAWKAPRSLLHQLMSEKANSPNPPRGDSSGRVVTGLAFDSTRAQGTIDTSSPRRASSPSLGGGGSVTTLTSGAGSGGSRAASPGRAAAPRQVAWLGEAASTLQVPTGRSPRRSSRACPTASPSSVPASR
jgi:hypothetical protein